MGFSIDMLKYVRMAWRLRGTCMVRIPECPTLMPLSRRTGARSYVLVGRDVASVTETRPNLVIVHLTRLGVLAGLLLERLLLLLPRRRRIQAPYFNTRQYAGRGQP